MIGWQSYIKVVVDATKTFNTYHSKAYSMTNKIPETFALHDGWYWSDDKEAIGPFASENEAINDYMDNHVCEEE
jgi:hypothetical protein